MLEKKEKENIENLVKKKEKEQIRLLPISVLTFSHRRVAPARARRPAHFGTSEIPRVFSEAFTMEKMMR